MGAAFRGEVVANILGQLLSELATGRLRVVDLTQPLSAETPVLPLKL